MTAREVHQYHGFAKLTLTSVIFSTSILWKITICFALLMYSHIEILHKEHLVWLGLEPVIVSEISIGWKMFDFVPFLTVFQSY